MECKYLSECGRIAEYRPQVCRTSNHTCCPLYDGKVLHEKWSTQDEKMMQEHHKFHPTE